jgi:hypothetical protein
MGRGEIAESGWERSAVLWLLGCLRLSLVGLGEVGFGRGCHRPGVL